MKFDYSQILTEFFEKDGTETQFKTIKRSILLALIEDMKYCVQLPEKWKDLKLTEDQWTVLQRNLPSFTVALQFCTGVDLLARVWKARKPKIGQNSSYFISTLKRWYGTAPGEARQLWEFRNDISHSYNLQNNTSLKYFGSQKFIVHENNGYYSLYLHSMYSSTIRAKSELYNFIQRQSPGKQRSIARFLEEYCFFYII